MSNYYSAPQPPKRAKWKTWHKVTLGVTLLLIGALCCGGGLTAALTDDSKSAPAVVKTIEPPVTDTSPAATGEKVAKAVSAPPAPTVAVFGSGSYEIGKTNDPEGGMLKAGSYTITTPDHCYWERVKDFDGEFDSIISNGNVEDGETVRVTVKKTDAGINLTDDCVMKPKAGR